MNARLPVWVPQWPSRTSSRKNLVWFGLRHFAKRPPNILLYRSWFIMLYSAACIRSFLDYFLFDGSIPSCKYVIIRLRQFQVKFIECTSSWSIEEWRRVTTFSFLMFLVAAANLARPSVSMFCARGIWSS